MENYFIKIKDLAHWQQIRDVSSKKLLVVDVHKGWCGPCKAMEPTYKRIFTETDNAEERLLFTSYCSDIKATDIPEPTSCKPCCILFKDKKQIAQINGANAPSLEKNIKQHLPLLNPEEDR